MAERVLFAVLDWGLGHATRSASLIEGLLTQGCAVVVASSGLASSWLRERFPECEHREKPGAVITYTRRLNGWHIAKQAPKFLRAIETEQRWISEQVKRDHFDKIISDNCYGVFQDDIHSILMTHQLNLPVPAFARPLVNRRLHRLIGRFDEVWVPDVAEFPGLGGALSHGQFPFKVKYIGWQSQFSTVEASHIEPVPFVAVISGPEPHRTLFEEEVTAAFRASGREAVIFSGRPDRDDHEIDQVKVLNHASASVMKAYLLGAEKITCRSGYSTLMDLHVLGVGERIERMVPTPGQWEQEYLARLFAKSLKA